MQLNRSSFNVNFPPRLPSGVEASRGFASLPLSLSYATLEITPLNSS